VNVATGGGSLGSIRGSIIIDYDAAGVARARKDVDGLNKNAKDSEKAWSQASKAALVGGLAIAGGFALAVNSAADFEQGLANIRAVSGATGDQMDAIRKKALQLGADTSFSAKEAAGAIEELAKAGVSLPDILNGAADATVALAAAGGIALPEAATIAANAMNQFALSAKDLPKVADLIAGAANASAIDVSQFGFSLAQVGAVAHLAGVSFGDTATAIALLGNAGIVGSDAGTSLKSVFQNLIPTTKQQIELSKQLGLITKDGSNAFFDASGKVKSLADVSQVLQNATKNLTKEQKLAALGTLFGSDAIRGAAILAENGAEGFNKMADAMDKVKAADVAAIKMDTLKGKLDSFKGSLETAGIVIGTTLLPALTKIVKYVTSLVNAFTSLDPSTQRIILTIIGVVGAILLLVAVTYKIIKVIEVFKVVWAALNIEFLFSPIGLIIIAIIALVAIIVLIATKTTWFQSIWHAVWGFLKTIGAWFAGPFAGFFVDAWNKVWNFFKAIGAWFAGPFAGFFVKLWNNIVSIWNAIYGFFAAIVNRIVGVFMAFWNVVSSVIGFFAPLFKAVFGLIVSVVQLAWSIITALIQVGITFWSAIISAVLNFIVARWNEAWALVSAIIQAVWGFIGPYIIGTIQNVRAGIEAVLNWVIGAWNATWNFLASVIQAVWGFIGPYVISTVEAIRTGITIAWNFIRNFLVGTWNFIVSAVTTVWNGISAFFGFIWNGIVSIFTSARDRVVAIINGIKAIVDRIRGFFNDLRNAAAGGTDSLIAFVKGIPGKILGAIGNLGASLFSKGRDLIQGLINGIKGMGGRIRDALIGLLPGPLKSMAGMLGLASPSKLFKKWGIWTVQGFINGITSMYSGLQDAMASVANVAANPGAMDVRSLVSGSVGISGASTAAAGASTPAVNVAAPQVLVVADLGRGVREVVRTTVSDEPELVASAAASGKDYRDFKSGRS
jgi:TP901 family phage tail tape measure protein